MVRLRGGSGGGVAFPGAFDDSVAVPQVVIRRRFGLVVPNFPRRSARVAGDAAGGGGSGEGAGGGGAARADAAAAEDEAEEAAAGSLLRCSVVGHGHSQEFLY